MAFNQVNTVFLFFSIEFFGGVCRGGLSRWSVDPVHWTGPWTGDQCFRVTLKFLFAPSLHATCSNIQVMRIKEVIAKDKMS